jgi:hypothetical protein
VRRGERGHLLAHELHFLAIALIGRESPYFVSQR